MLIRAFALASLLSGPAFACADDAPPSASDTAKSPTGSSAGTADEPSQPTEPGQEPTPPIESTPAEPSEASSAKVAGRLNSIDQQLEALTKQLKVAQTQLKSLQSEQTALSKQVTGNTAQTNKIEKTENQLESLLQRGAEASKQFQEVADEVQQLQASVKDLAGATKTITALESAQAESQKKITALEAANQDHQKRIAAGEEQMAAMVKNQEAVAKVIQQLSKQLEQLPKQQLVLQTLSVSQAKTLEEVDALADRLQELEVRQLQLARPGTDGDLVLDVKRQMQNPEFQKDFGEAVDEAVLRRRGHFIVHNRMSTQQKILVNGVERKLKSGEVLSLPVSPGTVTTQVGSEPTKTWKIGPPEYRQSIDIVPAPQPLDVSPTED